MAGRSRKRNVIITTDEAAPVRNLTIDVITAPNRTSAQHKRTENGQTECRLHCHGWHIYC
jgi:hypothetical protein